MKKIVLAIDSNTSGGAERVIATLANQFVNEGHNVVLVNADSESNFYKIDDRVSIIKLNLDKEKNKIRKMYLKYLNFKRIFQSFQPDAAICFLIRMEVPVILAGLVTKTNVFTSVRNSATSYSKPERIFRKIFYPQIAGVVFQSKQVQEFPDFRKVKHKKVIMNPLDDKLTSLEAPVPYEKRIKKIITAGRLNEQKNQTMLIDAFDEIANSFPGYELHIYGKGNLQEKLQIHISKKKNANRMKLMGEQKDAILNNRDAYAFVLSSNYEGFPNALVEAMACGIPSISTNFDSGVAEELISDGENGYLCKVNDVDSLTEKLITLLRQTRLEYTHMMNKSFEISKSLTARSIAKEWEQFMFLDDEDERKL